MKEIIVGNDLDTMGTSRPEAKCSVMEQKGLQTKLKYSNHIDYWTNLKHMESSKREEMVYVNILKIMNKQVEGSHYMNPGLCNLSLSTLIKA